MMGEIDIEQFFRDLLLKQIHNQTIRDTTPPDLLTHRKYSEQTELEGLNEFRKKRHLPEINLDAEVKSFLKNLGQKLNQIVLKLGDIIIVPGVCFIIGNVSMSDKDTYENVRDIFVKKSISLLGYTMPLSKVIPSIADIVLDSGQFSGGLKFIYAMTKYIVSKNIKDIAGKYKVQIDEDFIEYFKESQNIFSFIGGTAEPSLKKSTYRRSHKSYAKKILNLSFNLSILDKEKGESGNYFQIEKEQ